MIQLVLGLCNVQGMDIPDIELVIVNGIPDTISQLYQVFINW